MRVMSEQWKIGHDRRQYRLMIERLEAFQRKAIGIHAFISDLKGLLSALELRNEEWVGRANNEWGNLEIIYALECDRCEEVGCGFKEINSRLFEMGGVKKSVLRLECLIRERLED
jgi:hypothetical protein